MLNFINEAVKVYHQIPVGFWQAILASGVLSPLIHAWHRFRVTRKEKEIAEWAMLLIVIFISFAVSALQYLFTKHPTSTPWIIPLHTAVLSFTMTPTYICVVKPIWGWLQQKSADSNVYNAQLAELKRAVIPASGLPNVSGTSVSASAVTADAGQPDGF